MSGGQAGTGPAGPTPGRLAALALAGCGFLLFLSLYLFAQGDLLRQERQHLAQVAERGWAAQRVATQFYRLQAAVAEAAGQRPPRRPAAPAMPGRRPVAEIPIFALAPAAGGPDGGTERGGSGGSGSGDNGSDDSGSDDSGSGGGANAGGPNAAMGRAAAFAAAQDRIATELGLLRQVLAELPQAEPDPDRARLLAAAGPLLDRVEAALAAPPGGRPAPVDEMAAALRRLQPEIDAFASAAMLEAEEAAQDAAAGGSRRPGLYLGATLAFGLGFSVLLGGEVARMRRRSAAARRREQRTSDENAARSIFLATVSHEVRTPLNAITGFAELIQRQPFGPVGHQKYLEYVQDIIASTAHLRGLLDDVTDAQLVLEGQISLQEEEVRLRPFLAETLRIVRANCAGRYPPPRIGTRVAGLAVRVDRRRLRQVLINLLMNSIRYSDGQARILISAAMRNGALELAVQDQGSGIPPDLLERVFEPFQRGSHGGERGRTGMGLGLTIVRNIVHAHGGTVTIASAPGQGTTVTVRLPGERLVPNRPAAAALQALAAG